MSKFDIVQPDEFKKPTRVVHKVFLHCSASDEPEHDDPVTIEEWHLARTPPFNEIGYHYYVNKRGEVFEGRNLEIVPAAQQGHNTHTIAICAGGLEHFTDEQLLSVKKLCQAINGEYGGTVSFHGHREVNAEKTCPVYDYKMLLELDENGKMPIGG